jgi:hypothetical protein
MIVQLTKLWLTNTVNAVHLAAQTDPTRTWTASVKGEVRTYAGGRQRAVGSIGRANVWKFTLVELTQSQCETLEDWMNQGVTVLARDHRGQSMYGTFFGVERAENMSQLYPYATYTAAIELQRVDVVEGV